MNGLKSIVQSMAVKNETQIELKTLEEGMKLMVKNNIKGLSTPRKRRGAFLKDKPNTTPVVFSNYVNKLMELEMNQTYQRHTMMVSIDRVQFSIPANHYKSILIIFGDSLGTWEKKGRIFTRFKFWGRKTILHFNPKNQYRFLVDFHDMTPKREVLLVNEFQKNHISFNRRDVEIAVDFSPINPDDLYFLKLLFLKFSYLPYGRTEHFKTAGPHFTPTLYYRNGKNRSQTRHFNRIYIKKNSDGAEFLRVELQVNKKHEQYGVGIPVDFNKIKIEKLLQFRNFDYKRAVNLASRRCNDLFKKTYNYNPKNPYQKTADGKLVLGPFTESAIMRAHMCSIMRTVERPSDHRQVVSVVEQVDAYKTTPFYKSGDLSIVFPKIILP